MGEKGEVSTGFSRPLLEVNGNAHWLTWENTLPRRTHSWGAIPHYLPGFQLTYRQLLTLTLILKPQKTETLRTGRPFTFYDYMSNFWNPHHQSVVEQHLRAGDLGLEVPPVSVLFTSRPGLAQVLDY